MVAVEPVCLLIGTFAIAKQQHEANAEKTGYGDEDDERHWSAPW
jgi:hypothetical protein